MSERGGAGEDGVLRRIKATHTWRWVALYGAGALTVTQLIEPFDRAFGPFSSATLQAGFVLMGAGFFFTLILAWHHGEKGRQRVTRTEIASLGTIALVAVAIIWVIPRDEAWAAPNVPDPRERGIAVMPFAHVGHEDDRDRTRGIHAAVSTGVRRISALAVMDQSSVAEFEDNVPSASEAAALLGVRYVLFGQVQWADRISVQVTVRLVDGMTNVQLGSWNIPARYDDTADVFALQESIAGHVARAVQVEILPEEQAELASVPTADALAMDHLIQALSLKGIAGLDAEAMREAIAHARRAVERDSRYGEAWGRLAYLYVLARAQHGRHFPDVTTLMIEEALAQAERYAGDTFESQLARAAFAYHQDRDWGAAERHLIRLTRRFPNIGEGHAMLGFLLRRMDKWPSAIAELDAAVSLDPRGYTLLTLTAEANHMVGRFDRARELASRAEEVDPSLPAAPFNYVRTLLWGLGDTVATKRFLAEGHVEGSFSWRQTLFHLRGDYEEAIRIAESMGRVDPWGLAVLHAEAGNSATARMWADSGRTLYERRLAACPGPEVPSVCVQAQLTQLAVVAAIVGDTALARVRADSARLEHDRFHEGYLSSPYQSIRALTYVRLGRWEDATAELRELLSNPSYMHVAWLRIAPQFSALREAYPPFFALLDSVEAQGPLLERLER